MSLTEKNSPHNDDTPSGHINNPAKIFWFAMLFMLVVGVAMYFINSKTNDLRTGKMRVADSSQEGVASRLQPVAKFALLVVEKDAPLKTGQAVYESVCTTCHAAGVAGAHIFGDKAAWAVPIATGYQAMLQSVLNGKGAMPAKGGNSALKDIEVERAMVYIANAGGADFAEPSEPGAEGEKAEAKADAVEVKETVVAEATPAATPATAPATGGIVAATPEQLASGKALYDSACFVCHTSGVAGAPKLGDKDAWAPYIETGLDTMLQIAISGQGAMPPRGTAMNASDDDLRAAILYMIEDAR